MRTSLIALTLAMAGMSAAHAGDDRIKTEVYSNNRVYNINAQVGRTTLIQVEEGEALTISPSSVLGMGDAAAWNLSARGNNIIFKPTQNKPQTNLIFVTNKRTYAVDLNMASKGEEPTYILRFSYPDTEAAKAALETSRVQLTAAAKAEKVEINTEYFWRGDNEMLKPTAAWDDGRFTRLVYDNAAELPVFYKVLPDGTEALINTSVNQAEKNTVVLQEVIRTARARLGNDVIEITNHNYKLPKFNQTGSGTHGAVRVDKGLTQ